MYEQILKTKLFVPPLRPGIVARPRLLQKMSLGLKAGARSTIITAPAGYGKSTLALEWIQSLDLPHCWVSLDREDNHPVQFLAYLTAAINQIDEAPLETFPLSLESLDQQEAAGWLQSRLPAFINAIAGLKGSFILVLDDYHLITDLAIHQAVGFLMEHQPPQMHLVIATRQDPLLPLSKLRSRGWITEIRLGELRFTLEETTAFLNETMRLDLIPEQVAALEARTEGWIAGLQLAALSLTELPEWADASLAHDRSAIDIPAFAEDDRHIVDYLTDEVLSRQPEEIQKFLLQTSILKRLCGPLCQAVLGESEKPLDLPVPTQPFIGQSPVSRCQQILEYLEHANLFIIPQDNRRQWYRYHHLFVELLTNRLQATYPEMVPVLHCRASQWYENAHIYADAVDHALMAEDFDRALRLIENTASASIWASGDLPVLINWSRRLPENIFLTRPRLCLYYARGLFFAGQVEAAEKHIQQAENALRKRTAQDGSTEELWGVLYTNQATIRAMRGDSDAALLLAKQAIEKTPAADNSTQARILHAIGTAELLRGDCRRAEAAFAQGAALAGRAKNRNLGLDLLSCQALAQIQAGKLSAAASLCDETLSDPENRRSPAASTVFLALAQVQVERDALEEASLSLDASITLGIKAGWPHLLWQAYLLQARVRQALDDSAGWRESLRLAQDVVRRYPLPPPRRMVAAFQARMELREGNLDIPLRWSEETLRGPDGLQDFEELTLARVLYTQGNSAEALERLEGLILSAKAAGRNASMIEALVVRSKILKAAGDQYAAVQALAEAAALAQPEGFLRVFLDEGQELAELVGLLQKTKLPANLAGFFAKLAGCSGSELPNAQGTSQALSPDNLVEPLSARELEVLRLIADGLSNPEIASRLYLSVNTLRAHTTNIYQKLDVHSRLQAVNRARDLGLLG
jgi:LuxR family maltose regulon positive regulatory protein